MNYTYDPTSDALYIKFSSAAVDHTVELSDGVIADVDRDGSLVGVDVMIPSHGWDVAGLVGSFGLDPAAAQFLNALAAARWASFDGSAGGKPARNVTVLPEELVTTSA